ncbi:MULTISPECIES: TetR/AcrR family transcriptional regulator [unclassified Bacillus (in: firmicutes)]|uniref:TetR/AcrR family transcriptional regulator n=2 Tax=Bacillus TaxID=1386 RepID=UPI00047DB933|nr:TetR/AcrR family transcriptional regulator [Bacillus sp. NSP9.1]QHZ46409.1 TetR/AcrR family transcriptional regulator [Bacillus sp. NSP9.1]
MTEQTKSRDKILRTASRLFRKQGYHATGLAQITAESGAPRGSIYYYFPGGKEELAAEAIKLTGERIKTYISSTLSREADPVKAFQTYMQSMADGVKAHMMEENDDIPIVSVASETWSFSETLRKTCDQVYQDWQLVYLEKLTQSGFSKEKAACLSIAIQAMIEGAYVLSVTKKNGRPLSAAAQQIPYMLQQ